MRDGVCRASVDTLAGRLNVSRSTIKRYLKMLTDTGYLVDHTPDLRNRPHIYQPGSRFSRKPGTEPAPEPILPPVLPGDDDDSEDIPLTGGSERTTNQDGGGSQRTTTGAERTTRWVTENHRGGSQRAMSDTSLRDNRIDIKEDTDDPNAKAKILWEPIMQNLKLGSSKPLYEAYLLPITPHSWDGTTLTLNVPEPYLVDIIHARLGSQISRFLRAISENPDASIIITHQSINPSSGVDQNLYSHVSA
jgi:DNA-binding Lrp family transcriptional regulator